jgi:hypothetical protein
MVTNQKLKDFWAMLVRKMPSDSIPAWLTYDFLVQLRGEAEDHHSRVYYIGTQRRHYRSYEGSTLVVPVAEFDDMEISETQTVARYNKIKEVVDKVGSIFMKNNPVVRTWPNNAQAEQDGELSDDMDALRLDAWETSGAQFVVRNMLQESLITGLSIGKVYWNALDRSFDNNGSIAIEQLSPGSVLVDPWASNEERGQDAGFIFHSTEAPIGLLREMYGTKAEKALGIAAKRGRQTKKSGGGAIFAKTKEMVLRGASSTGPEASLHGTHATRRGYAGLTEVWLFPQIIQASDLATGKKITDDKYKYGMVVTVIEDEIVWVKKNPFATTKRVQATDDLGLPVNKSVEVGHRRHPFLALYWNRTADRHGHGRHGFYDCMGAVESMIPIQNNINALRRIISINARTIANPSMAVNEDALRSAVTNLMNLPSQIHLINQHYSATEAIKILPGEPLPEFVFQMLASELQNIEAVVGLEPGVVGLFPGAGGTSHAPGITIGAVQEAAFGPLWLKVAELAAMLLDASILYDGLIQQKYKPSRYMTVSNFGVPRQVQLTDRHITANFRRGIIQGATTPLADIDKQERVNAVVAIATNAIASQNPAIMQLGIAHIQALDFPWAHQFQQILEGELQKTLQIQQGVAGVGATALASQAQQPLQLEQGGQAPEEAAIAELSNLTGLDPADIAERIANATAA